MGYRMKKEELYKENHIDTSRAREPLVKGVESFEEERYEEAVDFFMHCDVAFRHGWNC